MLVKELIDIPERIHQSEFVLKLTDGVARPEETLKDYVVTKRLVENFDDALSFVAKALDKRESRAAFLHGSFGSGKSHFMAVLHMMLNGLPAARAHLELAPLVRKHKSLEGKRFLLLPFHMVGATSMESAILGGYVERVMGDFPGAPMPGVYLAEGLFADARAHLEELGDEAFFKRLNEAGGSKAGWGALARGRWNRESFEAAANSRADDPQRLDLISVLLNTFFKSYAAVVRERSENYVNFDLGLAQISRHASELRDADGNGFDGLILFLDELVLWLASRAGDLQFIHREMDKVVKLFEAEHSNRPLPIITFAARQRDLRDLVGEHLSGSQAFNFSDSLKHQEGRFHVIELEDSNLPEIIAQRILRPRTAGALDQLREAFDRTRFREDVKEVLLTSRYNEQTFKTIYPFSPALVETLVAVSSLLQRNRTAIRILMELLVDQQETLEVGQMIPVGDLFDYVSRSWEAYNRSLKEAYQAATNLLTTRFRPVLERTHPADAEGRRPPAYYTDMRLVHTLLLAALVPEVEALRQLTPNRLAALNQGTIKVPPGGNPGSVVLTKLRQWQPDIGELRIEDDTQVISLNLTSVDIESILEKVRHLDRPPHPQRKVRELLFSMMGVRENTQGHFLEQHHLIWKGTSRKFEISYLNVREQQNVAELAADGDAPRLILDFPFDEPGFHPSDDQTRLAEYRDKQPDTRTTVWLPRFLSSSSLRDLGRLVQVDYVLAGDRFETYTTHLSATDKPSARLQLDNVRSSLRARLQRALEMAYGIIPVEPGYLADDSHQLDLDEQFQSLHSRFQPRPPAASDLAQGLHQLLCQELAAHYPAHPEFPVDREITAAQVRSLWAELQPGFEGQNRFEVEKPARERFRQVAEPLKLGEMGDTHFVLGDHWKRHFQQELYKLGDPGRVSVRQLQQWTDEPRPMGLPPRLRNLVVLVFACQTNRNVVRGERLVEPLDPESLTPDMELVPQDLPSPEEWERAYARAAELLDKLGPMSRSVQNTNRLATRLREALGARREVVEAVPGELVELARALNVDPEAQPRLHTARLARALVELCDLRDNLLFVRSLAELNLPQPAALFTAMEQARHHREAFVRINHGVTQAVVARAEQGHAGAADLVATVREALAAEEIAIPLRPALDELLRRGPLLIVDPVPPPPPPPPPPGRRKIAAKSLQGLSPTVCRQELEELTGLMAQEGVRVDLSWTVWKDKP